MASPGVLRAWDLWIVDNPAHAKVEPDDCAANVEVEEEE